MATIKLGTTGSANRLISYAEKKAVEREGVDCNPEYAKSQFATTRELYGKTDGIQAHHVIQSFKPGEITPDQANKVGLDLAKKLGKGHECVVYTLLFYKLKDSCSGNSVFITSRSISPFRAFNISLAIASITGTTTELPACLYR